MALVGIELETIVSEPDALTTRPPPCRRKENRPGLPKTAKKLPTCPQ